MMLEYLICDVIKNFVGATLGLEAPHSVVCAQCCVVLCLMYCSHFELASAVTRRDRSDGGLRCMASSASQHCRRLLQELSADCSK